MATLSIDSITWLNGGMFVETYTPRTAQKLMSRTPLGDIVSHVQNTPLSRRLLEPTLREMFGPNTKPTRHMMDVFNQILDYNDGRRVLHKVGRFINDRYTHRNRWVRAMRQTKVPMRLIDGPVDPNSGAHMARRYAEVIPERRCGDARRRHRALAATGSTRCGADTLPRPHRPRHRRYLGKASTQAWRAVQETRLHQRILHELPHWS